MEIHEFATIFPLMEGASFDELVESIRKSGVREPIWLYDGKILDGRNRWTAAVKAGRDCPTREYTGADPLEFVIDLNRQRRHLTEGQLAIAAAKAATLKDGQRLDYASKGTAVAPATAVMSLQGAADKFGIDRSTVSRAKKILMEGTPEEIRAVEQGVAGVKNIADAIKSGVSPVDRQHLIRPRGTDAAGRRLPQRPLADCVDRGLDQLENTLETLKGLFQQAGSDENLGAWLDRLRGCRTTISRIVNQHNSEDKEAA